MLHSPQLSSSPQLCDFHVRSTRATLGECRACKRTSSVSAVCQTNSLLLLFATGNNTVVCALWDSTPTCIPATVTPAMALCIVGRAAISITAGTYYSMRGLALSSNICSVPTRAWERTQQLSNKVYQPLSFTSSCSSSSSPKNPRQTPDECEQADLTKLFGGVQSR